MLYANRKSIYICIKIHTLLENIAFFSNNLVNDNRQQKYIMTYSFRLYDRTISVLFDYTIYIYIYMYRITE